VTKIIPNQANRKRGWILSLLILIYFFTPVYVIIWRDSLPHFGNGSNSNITYTIFRVVLYLTVASGLILWKKWAVYLMILLYLLEAVIYIFLFKVSNSTLTAVSVPIILGLNYFIFKSKWKYFN